MRVYSVLLAFILLSASLSQAKILIVTVAQVKSHVITSREVEIHKIIDKTLGARLEDFNRGKVEENIIREWLLFFEASAFYNSNVSGSDVNKSFSVAKGKLKKSKKWKKLSVSDSELREKMKRRLEADRLYVFKKKASVLPVAAAEIETEYTQNRIRYGNLSFEEAKEKIRKNKIDKKLKHRLVQWFSVLEKKYKVQRFSKFN